MSIKLKALMGFNYISYFILLAQNTVRSFFFVSLFTTFSIFTFSQNSSAACGGTSRIWDGSSNDQWSKTTNWSANNVPDTAAEDAIIAAATKATKVNSSQTIGCLEVQSGQLKSFTGTSLTIMGDYFRNLTANGFSVTHSNFFIYMSGSGAQTFENVDPVSNLSISNNSSVTLTLPFTISTLFSLTGTTSNIFIDADVTLLSGASDFTIPQGVTVELRSGATFTANTNIIVNGNLILGAGTSLVMGNGNSLTINSTGNIDLQGANGNSSIITSTGSGSNYSFSVAGLMNADYFRIDRMDATGINLTGTLQSLDNGEFHSPPTSGYALTLGAAASIPTTIDSVGFYDDDAFGNIKNFNATSYTGAVTSVTNWSGAAGGSTNETDPSNKINWGAQAGILLIMSDSTQAGSPPATINQSSGDTLFTTLAFSLNQTGTATNITSLRLSMTGTASSSDITNVKIFKDSPGGTNCQYDVGVDTQVDTSKVLSGSPPEATFTLSAGDAQTSSDTDVACVHIITSTTATAQDAKIIEFSVSNTSDVSNDQGYSFSPSSGPPITGGNSSINGVAAHVWQGDVNDEFTRGQNWNKNTAPNSTSDCIIGSGVNVCRVDVTPTACQNATLQTGGTMNFEGFARNFEVYSALEVQSGFTFSNAALGKIIMRGATNRTLNMSSTFPGSIEIANTGTSPNNLVTTTNSFEIQGSLVLSQGSLLVPNGVTLTVLGNITVQSGTILDIDPGGTLILAEGSVLTVDLGGQLNVVGTASLTSTITSNSSSAGYSIIINGQIGAKYYSFDHLGAGGLTVETGGAIHPVYTFDNGSFTYPADSSMTFLTLKVQVPGHAFDSINMAAGGSPETGITNIDTTGAASGTLAVTNYSGDLAGSVYDTDPLYFINWSGETNTIDITQEQTSPATVEAGSTYVMGRYGFQQSQAGASFSDADVTALTLRLNGTGSSSDVSAIRVYADSNCDSANGILIGSGVFSGSPATKSFAITPGDFVVAADAASPPMNCLYVEYDVATGASNTKTIGVQITSSTDITNDQAYEPSGSTVFPLTLGSSSTINGANSTVWTGGTDTDWFTALNWSAGLPDSTKNCIINNVTNDPVINGGTGTAICKNVTIGDGVVTFLNGTGAVLEVHASLNHTGTFVWNDGFVEFNDGGTASSQNLFSTQGFGDTLRINKTGGGSVSLTASGLTVWTINFVTGNTGEFIIPANKNLIVTQNLNIPNGALNITGGGTLKMSNGTTITVNGGTFKTTGLHDVYPQSLSQKGKVTVNGAGTWGFTATSGTVSLVGFVIDYINTDGLNVGGTTNFTDLRGGHFTNLSETYASVTAVKFNTSSVPTSPSDVEFYWGPNNTPPTSLQTYLIASSTGCGGNIISFNQWWGDFFDDVLQDPDTDTKISETNCDIVLSYANSPVSVTHLSAIGFDSQILLDWTTGLEMDHKGFNIYRSSSPAEGYIQINSELVRNNFTNIGPHGSYRYLDDNVVNGQVYFYMIEDVSLTGVKKKHGPVSAMAFAGLGTAPPVNGGTNDGGSSDDNSDTGNGLTPGVINNPDAIDLGNGVHILTKTLSSMRLEIIPPAAEYTISPWNAAYESVNVPGYTKSLQVNKPELSERVILVEVSADYTSATLTNSIITEGTTTSHNIQPAPSWAPDAGGTLIPSYNLDATAYNLNSFSPNAYFELDPNLQVISNKTYVKVTVWPLKFNAVTEQVSNVSKIILDIGLDGQAWQGEAPNPDLAHAPSAIEGTLRIRFTSSGMYEFTYDDLLSLGLEGYFANAPVGDLRLYLFSEEVALDINDGDGVFNTGDSIRFWGDAVRSTDSNETEVVLTRQDVLSSGLPAKRYTAIIEDPSLYPMSNQLETERKAFLEENLMFINDRKIGSLNDHFYWLRLGKWNANGKTEYFPQFHTFNIDLPGLVPEPGTMARLNVYVRGRTQYSQNATHHLGVWVNSVPYRVADKVFNDYYPTRLSIEVPASYFIDGINDIRLEAMPDTVPTGDWAIIDIDRLEVEYYSSFTATNNSVVFYKIPQDETLELSGFSSPNIKIYDLSDNNAPVMFNNLDIFSNDGNVTYNVKFVQDSVHGTDLGYRLVAIEDSAVKVPDSIFIATGYKNILKNTNNQADMIVIGFKEMLHAASDLIDYRRSEGLTVLEADLEQIYAEYSFGVPSKEGIKDFLKFAYENWQLPKARYVLFLGDATYDLKDHLNNGHNGFAMPVPLLSGEFIDFGSDSWFATFTNEIIPDMAVGRIPASNVIEMQGAVDKLISYENGLSTPSKSASKVFEFFSDTSTFYEVFSKKSLEMASTVTQMNPGLTTNHQSLDDFASEADMKTLIISKFNSNTPLVMAFTGHGSEDQWAGSVDDVLLNTDAKALANTTYPIVLGLNCRNGYYYYADLERKSLSEDLFMNPQGGAIAFWGSTGYTAPESQVVLNKIFLQELAKETKSTYHTVRLGDLTLKSKASLTGISSASDTIRSWTLIGDPATKIPRKAFAEPPAPEPTPTASPVPPPDDSSFGCGRVSSGPPGSTPPPATMILLLMLPALMVRYFRRKRA